MAAVWLGHEHKGSTTKGQRRALLFGLQLISELVDGPSRKEKIVNKHGPFEIDRPTDINHVFR